MSRSFPMAALAVAALLSASAHAQEKGKSWSAPHCKSITGTGSVTFTDDEGATLTPSKTPLLIGGYTYGLIPLDRANTLLAAFNRTLYRSTSAGCRWDAIGTLPSTSDGFPASLVAGHGGIAYAWAEGRNDLLRIVDTEITPLRSPGDLVGIGTDRADGDHLRVGDSNGQIWESFDGGFRFDPLGAPGAGRGSIVYRVAFDPNDLDHAVVGTAVGGAAVTFDGGRTWNKTTGLSRTDGPVNFFNAVVSPADGNVVYAMALDLDESDSGASNQGRHIYRSENGGLHWVPVVDADPANGVTIVNQPIMAAHPTDADVVYFIFGTKFQAYGTDLYRYEHGVGLTKTHNDFDRMSSIAFHPGDPSILYLGLDNETGF